MDGWSACGVAQNKASNPAANRSARGHRRRRSFGAALSGLFAAADSLLLSLRTTHHMAAVLSGKPVLLDARVTSGGEDENKTGPRQQWIDVSFSAAPVSLAYISFYNYYCASITISHTSTRAENDPKAQLHMKGRAPTWQVAVPKLALMSSPHCEDDAQRYHELTKSHFAPEFDHARVTRLRICCLQPSPTWREYGLRQLRFYGIEHPSTPVVTQAPSLSTAERDLASTVVDHLLDLAHISHQLRQTIASASSNRQSAYSVGAGAPAPRRTAADGELAPYFIGEWTDELKLERSGGGYGHGPPVI